MLHRAIWDLLWPEKASGYKEYDIKSCTAPVAHIQQIHLKCCGPVKNCLLLKIHTMSLSGEHGREPFSVFMGVLISFCLGPSSLAISILSSCTHSSNRLLTGEGRYTVPHIIQCITLTTETTLWFTWVTYHPCLMNTQKLFCWLLQSLNSLPTNTITYSLQNEHSRWWCLVHLACSIFQPNLQVKKSCQNIFMTMDTREL